MKTTWIIGGAIVAVLVFAIVYPCLAPAGQVPVSSGYTVLEPIRHGALTIFPVVAGSSHDTREFITLDEGLRSGEVVVSEAGSVSPLVRPRDGVWREGHREGAQVNSLVLVNNSKRPLILLAGEIVTGGKQDRIIGKDRLVPAESDPIDLGVFCVEPGRWVGSSQNFGMTPAMVQPSVRAKAMSDKDQQKVWNEVGNARHGMAAGLPPSASETVEVTSSYAGVVGNTEVQRKLDAVAVPVEREYQSLIHQLKDKNAVGVVVAVNGEIIWADIFASSDLLGKYWPKLVRSYAAEAVTSHGKHAELGEKAAQQFLADLEGRKQVVENEPGLFRHTETTGDSFRVFELTSLLPKTGFDVHIAKIAD
jgi:sulfur carrier protein ThiS